jgi:radical SAM superfamily enzyme YgiQ (UPF0313 family)
MTKIILINPGVPGKILLGEGFPPLGLAYIAAVLEKEFSVEILDLTINPKTDFVEYLNDEKPDVVGFTATTPQVNTVFKLIKLVKENTDAKIIVGGPHPTALPHESIEHGADFVVRGEGEMTIYELCKNLERPERVDGISYMKNGGAVHNPDRKLIEDLDRIPLPARHLLPPLKKYFGQVLGNRRPIGHIVTSRGCPYNCVFCYKKVSGMGFRARSPANVIKEWKILVEDYQVREIAIFDDVFTQDVERVKRICDKIIQENLIVPWACLGGIRADTASIELLDCMHEAGCYRIAIGVESGSQKVLNKIGKNVKLEEIELAFKNAKEVGIETNAFFVLGNPGENRESMEKTIEFAKKLDPTYCQFTIATPYPGSRLYDMVREKGKFLSSNWDDYGVFTGKALFELGEVRKDLVEEMYEEAYRAFYLRPTYILKKVFHPRTYKHLRSHIRGVTTFLT